MGLFMGLEVLMFPGEARSSGTVEVEDDTSVILHFPKLCLVVELDLCGPCDFQRTDGCQVNHLTVETRAGSVGGKGKDCGIHVVDLSFGGGWGEIFRPADRIGAAVDPWRVFPALTTSEYRTTASIHPEPSGVPKRANPKARGEIEV